MIERHVNAAIDNIIEMGQFDIAYDLVAPILAGIACEHMGLDAVKDPRRFFDAQMHMVDHGAPATTTCIATSTRPGTTSCRSSKNRRAEPRDDVITALTQWDPPFTDEQIHMMIMNVDLGANDTTKSLLAQVVIYIDQHPELRAPVHRTSGGHPPGRRRVPPSDRSGHGSVPDGDPRCRDRRRCISRRASA